MKLLIVSGTPSIPVGVSSVVVGHLSAWIDYERVITQTKSKEKPGESPGIFDYVMANRWNGEYKKEAFVYSLKKLIGFNRVAA